jgi:hypothetical protein
MTYEDIVRFEGKWVGNGDKQTYVYDVANRIINQNGYKWNDETNDWTEYYRNTDIYDGDYLSQELTEYWNSANQDWNGLSDDNS